MYIHTPLRSSNFTLGNLFCRTKGKHEYIITASFLMLKKPDASKCLLIWVCLNTVLKRRLFIMENLNIHKSE